MSSKPRLAVVAPAAVLCVLALGAGYFFMSGSQEDSLASSNLSQPVLEGPAAARQRAAKAKPKLARPAAKQRVAPKPTPKPKPKVDPTLDKGLPSSVAMAFSGREVVVVSLYAPDVPLDELAVAEARSGATSVGAGFVALNVYDESQARPLTKLLGVLEDPTVLVFKRPGSLFLRLAGFADAQTVEQAARNASL
jgi:hypothetical protein